MYYEIATCNVLLQNSTACTCIPYTVHITIGYTVPETFYFPIFPCVRHAHTVQSLCIHLGSLHCSRSPFTYQLPCVHFALHSLTVQSHPPNVVQYALIVC